jgi:hypothetical protein
MIISARIINKPRVIRKCEDCLKDITGSQLRLYGYAETGDKPYVIHMHPYKCNSFNPLENPDIQEALTRNSNQFGDEKL